MEYGRFRASAVTFQMVSDSDSGPAAANLRWLGDRRYFVLSVGNRAVKGVAYSSGGTAQ